MSDSLASHARPGPAAMPSTRTVLSLVAGRGAFRLANYATGIALLGIWGSLTFSTYASAVGTTAWIALLSSGTEKAALKLLPRIPRLAGDLTRLVLIFAAAPVAATSLVLLASLAAAPASVAVPYLAAAAWSATLAMLVVVAALHRVAGRPSRDVWAFSALAGILAGTVAATYLLDLTPRDQLLLLFAATLVLTGWSARGLARRHPPRRRSGRALAAALLRTAVLMGLYEPLCVASVGVLYAALALSGQRTDSTALYLLLLVSGAVSSLLLYLLRIAAPVYSSRFARTGAVPARKRAQRVLRWSATAGLCGVALIAIVAWARPEIPALAVLIALVCVEIPVHCGVSVAVFLTENTGRRAVRVAALGAVTQFVSATVLAAVLVPVHGTAGALAALVLSLCALSGAMLFGSPRTP